MNPLNHQNPLLTIPDPAYPTHVAVIGAGTIGPDIGYYLVSTVPGMRLTLVDVAQASLDSARERLAGYVAKGLKRGKLSAEQGAWVEANVNYTLDYDAIAGCDWVLEAATENVDLKRRIFAEVEARVAPDCIITSNTSSLPAALIFSDLAHKRRATVTHFFAPAFSNPAVEIVDWAAGDHAVVERLRWIFAATGKVPMVTEDVLCFMLDRVFDNWCNEAGMLLGAGITAEQVDSVAGEFVHAGPFYVLNIANGNPIIIETNTFQAAEEGEHYTPAPIFRSVDRWKTVAPGRAIEVDAVTKGAIRDRLLGVLFSQTVDIVDRGIAASTDLELGCRIALGFKKGPIELMQQLGAAEVERILQRFAAERPGMPMPGEAVSSYLDFQRHVLEDVVDGVKVITIRRPDALNALHDEMTDEILAVIRRHEDDDAIKGFVLTGYGTRAFCAGGDIGRFPSMLGDADASAQYARDCSRLLRHLDGMTKPVVAALNGMALGGGFELAIRCHDIVALDETWVQMPEITLGISHGIGAMVVPYRKWPHAAATFDDMLRLATRLDAAEAHRLGIFGRLCADHEALLAAAVARVAELAGHVTPIPDGPVDIPAMRPVEPISAAGQPLSAEVIAMIERDVAAAAAAPTLAEALEVGHHGFGASACTAAAKEGIGAFVARRKPDFSNLP